MLAQIVYEPLAPPSARGCTLGPAFDTWFARSCARDPAKRFSSVGEQVESLRRILQESPDSISLNGATSGAPSQATTKRDPWFVVGIIGGVIGGWLAQAMGFGPTNGLIAAIVVATLGSIVVRLVLNAMDGSR